MGKKSLTQSTTKKKTTAKKKMATTAGKTVKQKKSPVKLKTDTKKAPPKKVVAPKAAMRTAPKKAAPVAKPQPTIRELILKPFDAVVPSDRYVPPGPSSPADITAPAFFTSDDPAAVERVRGLLKQTFDMADIAQAGRKAAAEKAAAEKAAAEKAAAEKAAAEKAAAEKAAAEKAAAEKAAAEKASITYEKPAASSAEGAMDKGTRMMVLGLAAGVALIFLMIIGASLSNTGKFYIKPDQGAIEIWQGKFAPKGETRLMTLPGVTAPEPAKAVYAKGDVFPLIFTYYVDKSDALLHAPGFPDLEGVRTYIERSLPYAVTPELKEIAYARMDGIDRLILLYKADVAAEQNTREGLETALGYIAAAGKLVPDEIQAALMTRKAETFQARLKALQAEAEAVAAREAEAGKKADAQPANAEMAAAQAKADRHD